ncbi:hypothetical protein [Acetobacter persici]|uniref:Uncharacterized protein n=1 Tax=Acetobacter persici TaxID=1076596 RepID=A0A1U9LIS0_9PROT|nr:hypothetical protein [Acetobacter persici]AQT06297.1 hypothetical protein A0U91_14825 [Acetobacter persici]
MESVSDADQKAINKSRGILGSAERILMTLTEDGAHGKSGIHVAYLWGLTVADRLVLTDDYAEAVSRTCDTVEGLKSLLTEGVGRSFEKYAQDPTLMIIPLRGRRRLVEKCAVRKPSKKKLKSQHVEKISDENDWIAILAFCPDGNPDSRSFLFAWGDDKFGFVASWAMHWSISKVKEICASTDWSAGQYSDVTKALSINGCVHFTHDGSFDLYGKEGVPGHEQSAIMMTEIPFLLCAGAAMQAGGVRKVEVGDKAAMGGDQPHRSLFVFAPENVTGSEFPSLSEKKGLFRRKVFWQ